MVYSRTASTCSRVTPGNHERKSSTEAPPSRFSKSATTGTRVERKTHEPLTLSGSRSTAGHEDQSNMRPTYSRGFVKGKSEVRGARGFTGRRQVESKTRGKRSESVEDEKGRVG